MSLEIRLFYRQKLLLALLQALGGEVSRTRLQKYLFLLTKECQQKKSYEFVPHRYGCFSFQSHNDLEKLKNIGVLKNSESWILADKNVNFLSAMNETEKKNIFYIKNEYGHLETNKLLHLVYKKYPYHAIRSTKAKEIMNENEYKIIESYKIKKKELTFFTIGYEGKTLEGYINQLIENDVRLVCDVRKNPLSRKYGFSKATLSDKLETFGITYEHIPELGIASKKRQRLDSDSDYKKLFNDYKRSTLRKNLSALDYLEKIFLENKRIAITCFERDHHMCHRHCIANFSQQRPWKDKIIHL